MTRLTLDHAPVDPSIVTYNPGVGFGRFHSETIEVRSYQLFVDRAELLARLSATYRATCQEIREDDETYGDDSDFTPMGYCDLEDAFSFPDSLAEAIDTYFVKDILDFAVGYREPFVYVINSVDRIAVSPDGLALEGRCFRHLR